MKIITIYLIKTYQFIKRKLAIRPCCRFTPTCSEYARLALVRYSFWKALGLIIKRLAKCHPFHEGGMDPLV